MPPESGTMRLALRLARRGYGRTSPNPMVGAVLVRDGVIIGRGWHHRAGEPHAEIEALQDAQKRGHSTRGATLYVTLEPCCTHGRTPPCTKAIVTAGIKRVVAGATDPNPRHRGRAFRILRRAGLEVTHGVLAAECERLNEAFNHWIVRRTPFVTVKAAMTLDGKIATATGESKWITGEKARGCGMKLRQGSDAILVGINTVLADDPSLTVRGQRSEVRGQRLLRIVLDARARTPLSAKVVSDEQAGLTTIVVSRQAPGRRVAALAKRVRVLVAPDSGGRINLSWLLRKLGAENVTSLLVEGGGEVNASFLLQGLAQRIMFFYAPKILGGRDSRRAVAGEGARGLDEVINLGELEWRRLGVDLLLTAALKSEGRRPKSEIR
ncbi:MAG: bifunctional diaminohydroxyphosphoribosylaminopyrimidine deaminase/5-amino-6-(5-phosphoribosylamino)uracil reductase RibD [Verrucomicrobia bacterium]|nr:bifunctional diaminohydroxyphosphoribosylaminopyrimidine deaminase/5-amino-6-(5-phosphoribosylamino)uracil reductase RibD [Verrucomicrobiota bacterium]